MSRLSPLIVLLTVAIPAAHAQLLGSVATSARGASLGASDWRASASLSSSLRFDSPSVGSHLDAAVESRLGAPAVSVGSFSTVIASPAFRGIRLVGSTTGDRDRSLLAGPDNRSANLSASYRNGPTGGWFGYQADRLALPSMFAGAWRQLGHVTVSVASTFRRGDFGGRPSSTFKRFVPGDSTFTPDSGWSQHMIERTFVDSGSPGRRLMWAETEARVGWAAWRVALDGVIGWRPRLDSTARNLSVQGNAAFQLSRDAWLCLGGGTVTTRLPFARSQGRFLSLAMRVSPAAFIRPKSPAPVTPSASSFAVRQVDRDYVVTIRVPKAHVVELAGDFNGWHAVRLTQIRADVWEATLPVAPGTYRMNIRVDGERWVAPPGTPQVDDEFNGTVGLVVIRASR